MKSEKKHKIRILEHWLQLSVEPTGDGVAAWTVDNHSNNVELAIAAPISSKVVLVMLNDNLLPKMLSFTRQKDNTATALFP